MVAHACNPSYSDAEAWESLKSGKWRLPLHSSLGYRASLSQKKKDVTGSHFGRPKQMDHLRSGVQDQPSQQCETLSLLKIQKVARRGGEHLWSWLLRRLRRETPLNLRDRWRVQWAKIIPLHSSLGNRVRLCLRKQNKYMLNYWNSTKDLLKSSDPPTSVSWHATSMCHCSQLIFFTFL